MKNNVQKLKAYYFPYGEYKNSVNNYTDYVKSIKNVKDRKYYQNYINTDGSSTESINKHAIDEYFKLYQEEEYKTEEKSKKMTNSYIYGKYKMRVYQSFSFILMIAVIITGIIISRYQKYDNYIENFDSVALLVPDDNTLSPISPVVYDINADIHVKAAEELRKAQEASQENRQNTNLISSSPEVLQYVKKYDMKYINQIEDKMPNGCEVVSLAMVLSKYIPNISAHEIYSKGYMPSKNLPSLYNGVYIGGDPTDYYIGNPGGMGYGIFAPGLVKAAQNTLDAYKIEKTAVNISGCSEKELFDYVDKYPVIVWCTMDLQPVVWGRYYWHFPNGKLYQYPGNEHCAVLVDYTDTTVRLYDPTNGIVDYDKTLFLQRWNEVGSYKTETRQAVIIK